MYILLHIVYVYVGTYVMYDLSTYIHLLFVSMVSNILTLCSTSAYNKRHEYKLCDVMYTALYYKQYLYGIIIVSHYPVVCRYICELLLLF